MLAEQPLVSIIIPTFNRAHLIGETLDSVLVQTYFNWECIIVDDGSTDNTDVVISEYVNRDRRFKYYKRPDVHLPGGNGARNYGFLMSHGEYIQWFDSDDLMLPNFLSRKVEVMEREKVDFVVSKSLNFDEEGTYEIQKYNGNFKYDLSGKNYILNKVYWMTPDFLIKKNSLKSYSFNETLKSGQETNFFIIFLSKSTVIGIAIDEYLSHRRIHNSSIRQGLKKSKVHAHQGKLIALLTSYNSIYKYLDNETKHFMQGEIMTLIYSLKLKGVETKKLLNFTFNLVLYKNSFKALAFFVSILLNSFFNKGYKLFLFSRS